MRIEKIGLYVSILTSIVLLTWISIQASDRYKQHKKDNKEEIE